MILPCLSVYPPSLDFLFGICYIGNWGFNMNGTTMTQVAVDKSLMQEAERLSNDYDASEVVENALKIYIGQLGLRSMFGTMKEEDFWDGKDDDK
jgi:hypothetical protein